MGAKESGLRYRIERAGTGFRVVGPAVWVWEESLGEAVERLEELAGHWAPHVRALHARGRGEPGDTLVYGPILSRRLGRSLGIDLVPPGYRVCDFDCIYCGFRPAAPPSEPARWPTPEAASAALDATLVVAPPLDSITISGHGEPTLHPRFEAMVDAVLRTARAARPDVPVRILTSGSQVLRPEVRRALDRLDERIVKLDADAERSCRPARGSPFGAALAGLASLRDVTLQSCFFEGEYSNTATALVDAWIEIVAEVAPRAVQIYTIDRPSSSASLRSVRPHRLGTIARRLEHDTGISARAFL